MSKRRLPAEGESTCCFPFFGCARQAHALTAFSSALLLHTKKIKKICNKTFLNRIYSMRKHKARQIRNKTIQDIGQNARQITQGE